MERSNMEYSSIFKVDDMTSHSLAFRAIFVHTADAHTMDVMMILRSHCKEEMVVARG